MSLHTTFDTWDELMEHLKNVDHPQCCTFNYRPDTNDYVMWIGNQPYYHYEKLIELEEKDSSDLRKRIKSLVSDKDKMYQLGLKAKFKKDDWKKFEKLFSN